MEEIINVAWVDASERQQEYLLLENILVVALKTKEVQELMMQLDVDFKKLQSDLDIFLNTEIEKVSDSKHPKQTIMFKKLVQYLIFHTQDSGKIAQVEDLLIAMFREPETTCVYLMSKYGIDEYALKELATELRHSQHLELDSDDETSSQMQNKNQKRVKKSVLSQFAVNLTQLAREGKIDPIIGRDEEAERLIQILCRKKKNNALMLGDSGVGKTSILEKMALDIVADSVPKQISGYEVYSIDATAMVAGAKFRGDFEKRLQDVLKELEEKEHCIAFIDEFHTMFGLGANSSNQLDATNILKPAMLNGKIKIVGATTYEEAKNTIDKNKPMARRFQKIDILEPDEETTVKILQGLKGTFEEFHNVSYTDKILNQIVTLSGRYLSDTHFPDKAIDVVDEVGSIIKLKNKTNIRVVVKEKDIIDLISKKARVPVIIEDGDDKLGLVNLQENIKAKLFGQDHAVDEVVDKIIMSRSGLNDNNKPLAAFIFAGNSGTGKCLAKDTKVNVRVSQELYNKILENRKL